ncbi:hypothetical protein MHYP_G00239420 [Metynnis hypsauchen]
MTDVSGGSPYSSRRTKILLYVIFSLQFLPARNYGNLKTTEKDGRKALFYRCFRALLKCETPQQGSSLKSSSKAHKPTRAMRRNDKNFTCMAASVGHTTAAPPSTDAAKPPMVSLVAHYNG